MSDVTQRSIALPKQRWSIADISTAAASAILLVMLIHVVVSVTARAVFSYNFLGTNEYVANWWMVAVLFLGLAAAHIKGEQIRVTALVDGTSADRRSLAVRFVALASALVLLGLTLYSGKAALSSFMIREQTFGLVEIPVWPAKMLIPLGLSILFAYTVKDLVLGNTKADGEDEKGSRAFDYLYTAAFAASLLITSVILFADVERLAIGFLSIVLMLVLMLTGLPVALAMIAAGLLGILKIAGVSAFAATAMRAPFGASASWSLSVLPMFILMGLIMWRSGFTSRVFIVFQRLIGFLPGGLAVTTNFAGAALASASGSSAGIAYALGRIALPEMLKRGYQPSLATAVVAMAGVIGNLIPPSIVLIVYAGVAQTPIGPQLLAAVIPGILISCAYGALIIIRCKLNPALAPREKHIPTSWGTKFKLLSQLWGLPLVIGLVLGSMYLGWATATEAGALGATAAAVIGILEIKDIRRFAGGFAKALTETVSSFSAIMFLFIGVDVLTRMVALSGVATFISDGVTGMELSPLLLILMLMVVYLVLGTFMDTLAIILLTVPLFAATLAAAQIDMVWFGVFITIMAELAVVTPPMGILAFIVHRMAQNPDVNMGKRISLTDVFVGCAWFVGITVIAVFFLIAFPQLALWLPGR